MRLPCTPFLLVAACLLAPAASQAPTSIRTWSWLIAGDTETFSEPMQAVSGNSGRELILAVTQDGRVVAVGTNSQTNVDGAALPPLPTPGQIYTRAWAGIVPVAETANGSLVQWSPFWIGYSAPTPPPTLPTGMTWISVATCGFQGYALRSDGSIVRWGPAYGGVEVAPSLSPGLAYDQISASSLFAAARVSDGSIRVWGINVGTVQTIPQLAPGITYASLSCGASHVAGLLSDHTILVWGDNTYGQCNVPSLPPGESFVSVVSGGYHVIATTSLGRLLAWGRNDSGQCQVPGSMNGLLSMHATDSSSIAQGIDGRVRSWGVLQPPQAMQPGARYRCAEARSGDFTALDSQGSVLAGFLSPTATAPALPAGVAYNSLAGGIGYWVARATDGTLRGWGSNASGQINIPSLPSGQAYVAFACGPLHVVAIRSDGQAVAWGDNSWGQCVIPSLPPGLRYESCTAGNHTTMLLRSDGAIVTVATGGSGISTPPTLPVGMHYTAVSCGNSIAAAIRTDGSLVTWGSSSPPSPPQPPPGIYFVQVDCGDRHCVARLSDGSAVAFGVATYAIAPPPLANGRSYVSVFSDSEGSGGLVGSTCRYQRLGLGCGSSLAASALIPADTPRIGFRFRGRITRLPMNAAVLALGLTAFPAGVALDPIGMPGCRGFASWDFATPITGYQGEGTWDFLIPDLPALVGLNFVHQSVVLDSGAGPTPLVMSDAMLGTIGS